MKEEPLSVVPVVTHRDVDVQVGTNPTHYGDPAAGCKDDERAVRVQGVSGHFCSPKCSGGECPSDLPDGVSAAPTCALRTPTGDSYCALICTPSVLRANGANGECGKGTCQAIQGVGMCTYDASVAIASIVPTQFVVDSVSVLLV